MTFGITTYGDIYFFFLYPSPPPGLPVDTEALSAASRALPALSKALPALSEAL